MKRLILALALLFAAPVFAQSNLNHWSIAGSASGFSGSGSAASITGISYQVTQHVSFGYQNVMVPGIENASLGVAQYATSLSSLLGKSLSSKVLFDASSVTVSFLGGAGESIPNVGSKKIAETAGVYVSIPMKSSASGSVSIGPVFGFQYLHGAQSGVITTPNSAAISAGLGISF